MPYKDPDKQRQNVVEYYHKNKAQRLLYYRKWRENNKKWMHDYNVNKHRKRRNNRLLREHNISIEQYEEMLSGQNGVCAICFNPEKQIRKGIINQRGLVVDHDHNTGNVRGLLCYPCNMALGLAKDDKHILARMILYLK